MKNALLLCSAMLALFASCSNDGKDKKTADSTGMIAVDTTFTPKNTAPANVTTCYQYDYNKSTASLKLSTKGDEITGDLEYHIFEKDANKGTITGEIKKDTIIADYTFDSEGMRSVRQVVFLRKGDKLYEGTGESEEKGGKYVFKNRAALNFKDNTIVFSPTPCK